MIENSKHLLEPCDIGVPGGPSFAGSFVEEGVLVEADGGWCVEENGCCLG